ncbi:3354_t:CDS:2 [Funneliformis geosporum]|uniref:5055_t:CDS:1 n=1 Tax=Funneliformis geosporum TaxID=1117311 RepID=A0A9W4SGA5_9GLOM|nr:5055_t:CDS:2 [Funneliformis geosporum]CAI2175290.1 3354_t:CDS:2 [Funneliformis geosporum]
MASSSHEFWSARWQLMLNESFKELGFLPVKNVFADILSAYAVSALLYKYLIIEQFDLWTVIQKLKALKIVLLLILNLSVLPVFIEPLR